MKAVRIALVVLLALASSSVLSAQEGITVPNVIGLTVPRAAAILNHAGLGLGAQSLVTWTPDASQAVNRIGDQSPAAGEIVESGSQIDISVFGSPDVTLVYDDNNLTVINLTSTPISMKNVMFNALDGASASFAASRWKDTLQPQKCFQIWSVSQTKPKAVDGCSSIQSWRWTGSTREHFWMTSNGVSRFGIMDGGRQQAVCAAASPDSATQPVRCDVVLAAGNLTEQASPYVYFAYTTEAFIFVNNTTDQWMSAAQTTIFNYNPHLSTPGLAVNVGDPSLYGNPVTVADIMRLAPGQCLLFTSDNPEGVPPEPCDVVAHLSLTSQVAFWLASFQVTNASEGSRRQCPAALVNQTITCILPQGA